MCTCVSNVYSMLFFFLREKKVYKKLARVALLTEYCEWLSRVKVFYISPIWIPVLLFSLVLKRSAEKIMKLKRSFEKHSKCE